MSYLEIKRIQEQIAQGYLANLPSDVATLCLRFEDDDLGPGTARETLWYFDAQGQRHTPRPSKTFPREFRHSVCPLSKEMSELMARSTPDTASGRRYWVVYLLTIDAATGHYRFEFEYEDRLRWDPDPNHRIPPFNPDTGECLLRDRG